MTETDSLDDTTNGLTPETARSSQKCFLDDTRHSQKRTAWVKPVDS